MTPEEIKQQISNYLGWDESLGPINIPYFHKFLAALEKRITELEEIEWMYEDLKK